MVKKKKKNSLIEALKRSTSGWGKAIGYVNSGKWAKDISAVVHRGRTFNSDDVTDDDLQREVEKVRITRKKAQLKKEQAQLKKEQIRLRHETIAVLRTAKARQNTSRISVAKGGKTAAGSKAKVSAHTRKATKQQQNIATSRQIFKDNQS